MFWWSIIASAWRSASNRAITWRVSIPAFTIFRATVRRTGRLVVVSEAPSEVSVAAEVAARVHEVTVEIEGVGERVEALTGRLRILGSVNRALVREIDETDLLREVCRIVVAEGGGSPAEINLRASDFVNMGREVEGSTLCRAVRWHAEHRVLLDGNRTVVFD